MKEYLPTVLLLRDKYKNEMKEFLFWMIYLSTKYENITPPKKEKLLKNILTLHSKMKSPY